MRYNQTPIYLAGNIIGSIVYSETTHTGCFLEYTYRPGIRAAAVRKGEHVGSYSSARIKEDSLWEMNSQISEKNAIRKAGLKQETKLPLCLIKHQAKKTYRGLEV
jgi:hypothetical protein